MGSGRVKTGGEAGVAEKPLPSFPSFVSLTWGLKRAANQRERYLHNLRNLTNKFIKMRVMTMTKTIKINQVTSGTVISGELNKSSKSNSPIIITPVFTIARPGAPNEGTVCCVRESKVPVEVAVFFLHRNTKKRSA